MNHSKAVFSLALVSLMTFLFQVSGVLGYTKTDGFGKVEVFFWNMFPWILGVGIVMFLITKVIYGLLGDNNPIKLG